MSLRVEETTSSASPASASVYELLVRSARSVTRILAIIVPPLCVVPVATGIAPLEPSLVYLAILESGFVALWWLTRGRAGERWPELLMFTATLLASGGVIFSPSHLLLVVSVSVSSSARCNTAISSSATSQATALRPMSSR